MKICHENLFSGHAGLGPKKFLKMISDYVRADLI